MLWLMVKWIDVVVIHSSHSGCQSPLKGAWPTFGSLFKLQWPWQNLLFMNLLHTFLQANKLAAKRKAHDDANKADKKQQKKKKCWFLYVIKSFLCFFSLPRDFERNPLHHLVGIVHDFTEHDVSFKFAQTGFQWHFPAFLMSVLQNLSVLTYF